MPAVAPSRAQPAVAPGRCRCCSRWACSRSGCWRPRRCSAPGCGRAAAPAAADHQRLRDRRGPGDADRHPRHGRALAQRHRRTASCGWSPPRANWSYDSGPAPAGRRPPPRSPRAAAGDVRLHRLPRLAGRPGAPHDGDGRRSRAAPRPRPSPSRSSVRVPAPSPSVRPRGVGEPAPAAPCGPRRRVRPLRPASPRAPTPTPRRPPAGRGVGLRAAGAAGSAGLLGAGLRRPRPGPTGSRCRRSAGALPVRRPSAFQGGARPAAASPAVPRAPAGRAPAPPLGARRDPRRGAARRPGDRRRPGAALPAAGPPDAASPLGADRAVGRTPRPASCRTPLPRCAARAEAFVRYRGRVR